MRKMRLRGGAPVWAIVVVLISCLPTTPQASNPVAKCEADEVIPTKVPNLEEARVDCKGKGTAACKVACTWKMVGILSAVNKFTASKYIALHRNFPQSLQHGMIKEVFKCISLGSSMPKELGATCSEFEPLGKCVGAAVRKQCEILDDTVFL